MNYCTVFLCTFLLSFYSVATPYSSLNSYDQINDSDDEAQEAESLLREAMYPAESPQKACWASFLHYVKDLAAHGFITPFQEIKLVIGLTQDAKIENLEIELYTMLSNNFFCWLLPSAQRDNRLNPWTESGVMCSSLETYKKNYGPLPKRIAQKVKRTIDNADNYLLKSDYSIKLEKFYLALSQYSTFFIDFIAALYSINSYNLEILLSSYEETFHKKKELAGDKTSFIARVTGDFVSSKIYHLFQFSFLSRNEHLKLMLMLESTPPILVLIHAYYLASMCCLKIADPDSKHIRTTPYDILKGVVMQQLNSIKQFQELNGKEWLDRIERTEYASELEAVENDFYSFLSTRVN